MELSLALLILFAYALGGIPFGLLLGRFFGDIDIRDYGSGNIGATNMNRILGRKLGAATLLCDVGKAVTPVLIARIILGSELEAAIVGAAAVVGHCFPIYLKFKGGKGVAAVFGALLGMSPFVAALSLVIWLIAFRFSKVSAVGALVSSSITPLLLYFTKSFAVAFVFFCLSVLIFVRHRENIEKLRKPSE